VLQRLDADLQVVQERQNSGQSVIDRRRRCCGGPTA